MKAKFRRRYQSIGDVVLDIIILITMVIIFVATLYPFLNSIAISFNFANDTTKGGITIFPRVFTLRNYELIFQNPMVYQGYLVSIVRTIVGTVTGLFFTALLAFGMAHRELVGRKFYTFFCLIPMYFGGGLMPYYFLINNLKLNNTFWVYIIPSLVGLWNMILLRTYFQAIPAALEESARIDGASYLTVFWKIIFPISTPIIATIALFIGVGHWNDWFTASIFMTKSSVDHLKPMQNVLLDVINKASIAERLAAMSGTGAQIRGNTNVRSLTMACMIATIVPIIIVYPFLQKYFAKGIMVGSLKG